MKLPRINVYVCQYGCQLVTVDVDKGVTPFMIKCRRKPTLERPIKRDYLTEDGTCAGTMKSSMYPQGPKPPGIGEPTMEWYRPDEYEINKMEEKLKRYFTENKEALYLRDRTDAEPIYHEEKNADTGTNS